MNLKNLFEMQKTLDDRIVKEKGLEGQDLLPKKILALQVELGELANEWRGFKFWSTDQEPRAFVPNPNDICESCNGNPIFYENSIIVGQCDDCDGCGAHFHNPLLEEYVDCLHFILSIGLEKDIQLEKVETFMNDNDIVSKFHEVIRYASYLAYDQIWDEHDNKELIEAFLELGELLGFTWEQIEQAYVDKNKVNHERQNNNY